MTSEVPKTISKSPISSRTVIQTNRFKLRKRVFTRFATALENMAKACKELANYNSDEDREIIAVADKERQAKKMKRAEQFWTTEELTTFDSAVKKGMTKAEIRKLLPNISVKEIESKYAIWQKAGYVKKSSKSETGNEEQHSEESGEEMEDTQKEALEDLGGGESAEE